MSYTAVLNSVPKPDYNKKIITDYQSTKDIIADLIQCFKIYNYQAKTTAYKHFYTGDITKDAKNIYDFIKTNITYDAEPFENQTTRSFSRIIHDKHGDCKHSALIVSCLAWNMGYDVIFRFVDYTGKGYGHVYTLIQDPVTKKTVIVDPLQDFNYEKYYKHKLDYIAKNNKDMTLTRLSGTNDVMGRTKHPYNLKKIMHEHLYRHPEFTPSIHVPHPQGKGHLILTPILSHAKHELIDSIDVMEGIGKKKSKAEKQAKKTARKTARKQKVAKLKTKIKAAGKGIKKVALTPVRAAFTALLLLNFRNFAARLKKLNNKNSNEVKSFATKFGWDYNKFMNTINKGATKKPLLGGKTSGIYDQIHNVQGIGIVLDTAMVASASAAIIAVVPLLKKHGLDEPHDSESVVEATDNLKNLPDTTPTAAPTQQDSGGAKEVTQQLDAKGKDTSEQGGASDTEQDGATKEKKQPGEEPVSSGLMQKIKDNPVPVVLGAGALIFVGGKLFKLF